jgi:hypothetical protein
MNNTCILCPQFFDWYSIREKVSNSIFIFRGISLFYLVYIWHCRIKLFLRHLPNCPCSDFSRYVDLFQEISPGIAKQLRFQVKLYHIRRKCKNDNPGFLTNGIPAMKTQMRSEYFPRNFLAENINRWKNNSRRIIS